MQAENPPGIVLLLVRPNGRMTERAFCVLITSVLGATEELGLCRVKFVELLPLNSKLLFVFSISQASS